MEQLTTLPRPGDPGAMEPWALPTWQSWTPGRGGEPGNAAPSVADTPPAALQLPELRSEESSEPKGARSSGPIGGTDPEEAEACLPSLGQQASSSGPTCQRPEDEEVEAFPKAKLNMGFGDRPNLELLRALGELRQRCAILKEENQMLRKSSFPETEEKVRRLKRKNAELAVIAKRLEERARKLQETNLRVVSAPLPRPGASLELCRKALARQRARDLSETASALLAKDKQIAALQRECRELQARLTLVGKEGPQWLHVRDFDRLLRESQREVLRLQRQIALRNQRETPPRPPSRPPGPALPARAEAPAPGAPGEATPQEDADNLPVILGEPEKEQRVQQLESELSKKRKKCESLEQEARKKQRRCEELELQLREAQNENARLVEENSRLSGRVTEKEQVEWENAELRGQLLGVTQERDSALRKSQGLQSKLESLEQVLKHMREVAQRRQQLEVEHEQARLSLREKQEEVRRLQQAQAEAKKEHEGAVQLLESTLDSMQARVRELEEQCRSQTEQFSLLAQELQAFRLHPGLLDLLTSALDCGTLGDRPPPPCCCSTPRPCRGSGPKDLDLPPGSPGRCTPKSSEPAPATLTGVPRRTAKKAESLSNSSHSESIHNSPKSCPTPEVDTASEVEELEADSVSLLPATPEGSRGGARIQVFLARYSYNPFEGPNENPEAELPLTAGEYIYVYGNMDEDGFFEGPPDAPLDVQIEPGPSPGILIISWLPVTIDAAGTSNGVRVTGYAIYADGQKIMEVASPTAGSVLVELSQLQLLQVCREVVVRTMSPHGESADSIPAPITPALAPASLPARVSCPSLRPSPEARAPLASASPGPGDPSSPLQHPAPLGTQEPPGAPPASPSREMPKGSHEDPPAPCSQEEAGTAVLGTSEERTASTSTLGEKDPGPAAPSLAKQEAKWTAGEACPAPSSAQGALAQQAPNTEACQGGDPGSGLRPRAEKEDAAELGGHLVNSLVDHSRNSDLSDIQEEEEEEEEEEELGSRTCSFQKQVAGNSIRENGAKATETREARGQDSSGRRGPQKRGARVPRPSTAELVPVRSPSEALAYQHLPVRIFVALFDYDPVSMSPNPDAGEEELPFREGQILKVFGDKDADGFYRGEGGGRTGYIPCNMVAEVAVDSPAGRQQLLQRGYLSPDILLEGSARTTGPPPKPRRSKKAESEGSAQPCPGPPKLVASAELKAPHSMVAAFDYNPQESSPNMDVEAELPFRAGDVITVFGGMDDDGFYYGELNGQRGLVPSNFLEGPGPEAGGLDREPRTPQAESQRTRRRRVQC
ncbi:peripheral-type benzodiazepine receptor-associated protein 1 isoform X18 [Chlorocebus sabaeus]|uniref:peripheral-type benzodiazepine receptor-associated protein 1 isoform X18 n=1 Tax=Chlorocebus sabaeus TaxID=60711 RepID=UPI003BF9446F